MTETIGQRLKRARKYRHISIEKAELATRIRAKYLLALEADDFSAVPSTVQARGFLRNYATFLEIDLDQVVDELRRVAPSLDDEVIFEGDVEETPLAEEAEAAKTASIVPEPQASSQWKTWLKRIARNSETGGASEVGSLSSGVEETDNLPNGDQAPPPAEPEEIPSTVSEPDIELAPVSEKDEDPETDAVPSSGFDALMLWVSLREWIKFRFSFQQPDVLPAQEAIETVEIESAPKPPPVPAPASRPQLSSHEIFDEIGIQLRQRREMLGLTLEEIERHTRMRAQFLSALEAGRIDDLPSPVQTRGMLTNYASFLDLDVDTLLLRFADALQVSHRERYPERTARRRGQTVIPENMPVFRNLIAGDLIFGVGMMVLLAVVIFWGISRVIAVKSERALNVESTAPSISEALIGTPVETAISEVTLIPVEEAPLPTLAEATREIPTLAADVNVQVNLVSVERTYLRVLVDGETAFDGRTLPGDVLSFEAQDSIEIVTGNAAALRVVYNQRDMGLLGGFGQVASYIYTADGIVVPTPASSPTPTRTPFLSPTPSATATPTATATPRSE